MSNEDVCPYCKSPMTIDHSFKLKARQKPIYDAVVAAGPEGVPTQELLDKYLPGCKVVTLRTCVHAINQIINPMCLRGKNNRYYLERVNWSMEGLENGQGEPKPHHHELVTDRDDAGGV